MNVGLLKLMFTDAPTCPWPPGASVNGLDVAFI
jgi:hypothetical protein